MSHYPTSNPRPIGYTFIQFQRGIVEDKIADPDVKKIGSGSDLAEKKLDPNPDQTLKNNQYPGPT